MENYECEDPEKRPVTSEFAPGNSATPHRNCETPKQLTETDNARASLFDDEGETVPIFEECVS